MARRVILMLTFNFGYQQPRTHMVLQELWEADAVVYAVIMAARKHDQIVTLPWEANVKVVASQTGGEFAKHQFDPERVRNMLDRVRQCYVLHFPPSPGHLGARRAIAVKLSAEARQKYPHATVLARRGYVLSAVPSP